MKPVPLRWLEYQGREAGSAKLVERSNNDSASKCKLAREFFIVTAISARLLLTANVVLATVSHQQVRERSTSDPGRSVSWETL
jgi:hypothetical protein